MRKICVYLLLILFTFPLFSVAAHKYYVAVFQMEYAPKKKVIQMTSRIFLDDLESVLNKKHNKKLNIGTTRELPEAASYIKEYLVLNCMVNINGKHKPIKFLGKEIEDDILVCYFTIPAEARVKTISIKNTTLLEAYPEQQNIIHTNINSNKKSLMLTNAKQQGTLDF